VASNVGGLPEIIEDGVTVRLPPEAVDAMAETSVAAADRRRASRANHGGGDEVVRTRYCTELVVPLYEAALSRRARQSSPAVRRPRQSTVMSGRRANSHRAEQTTDKRRVTHVLRARLEATSSIHHERGRRNRTTSPKTSADFTATRRLLTISPLRSHRDRQRLCRSDLAQAHRLFTNIFSSAAQHSAHNAGNATRLGHS